VRVAPLLLLAASACTPSGGDNQTSLGAPTPTSAVDSAGDAPAQTAAPDGAAAEPENRFVSCPGHPRCPKNQAGD
jgi:hypothetical protein